MALPSVLPRAKHKYALWFAVFPVKNQIPNISSFAGLMVSVLPVLFGDSAGTAKTQKWKSDC